MKFKPILCLLIITSLQNVFAAEELCKALVLHDVGNGDVADTLKRGSYKEEITVYEVNKSTGVAQFCAWMGTCHPAQVNVNGKKVDAFKLVNCEIDKNSAYEDKDTISYEVVRKKRKAH